MMARLWKILPAFLAALLLALALACSGGGTNTDSSGGDAPRGAENGDEPDAGSNNGSDGGSDELVSNATDVLGASVQSFNDDIESVRAEFEMLMEGGSTTVSAGGEFAYKHPDQLYMTMNFDTNDPSVGDLGELGTMEILFLGEEFYMYMPFFGGWFVVSVDELGEDFASFEGLLDEHSPFDYGGLIDALGDSVDDLGEESIDGGTFRHYRVTVDAQDVYDAFGDSLGDGFGENDTLGIDDLPTDVLSGPMMMDIWVDADSFLPHKLEASAGFDVDGASTSMTFSVRFTDYNADFDLPDPPADAQPIDQLFGDIFDFDAETVQ
jgi:outer membrane lipoprotein-sorting protein